MRAKYDYGLIQCVVLPCLLYMRGKVYEWSSGLSLVVLGFPEE